MERQITTLIYGDSYREVEGILNTWPTQAARDVDMWAHIDHFQVLSPNQHGKIGVFILWRKVPRNIAPSVVVTEEKDI